MILDHPLETDRLLLRSLGASDCGLRYGAWMRDDAVQRYLESRGSPSDVASLKVFVARANADPNTLMLGICERKDGRHVGNIKLGPIDRRHSRASIGIMIGERDTWGRGYASEAVRAVSDYAFKRLAVGKVTAGAYEDNLGSITAFRRAGFDIEARLRGHAVRDGARVDVILMARHA